MGLFVWLCLYTLSFSCCVVGNDAGLEAGQSAEYLGRGYSSDHGSNTRTVVREVTLTRSGPNPLQGGIRRNPGAPEHHLSRKLEEDDMIYTLPDDPDDQPMEERDEHRNSMEQAYLSRQSSKHQHSLQTLGGSNSVRPRIYHRSNRDYNQRDPQNNVNINDNIQTGDSDTEEDNDANAGDISDIRNRKFDTSKPPRRKSKDKYKTDSITRTKQGYSRKLPNGLIIGVKKGGTRALLEFLRIHPDIRAPGPEPHFFDRNYEKGLDWYR